MMIAIAAAIVAMPASAAYAQGDEGPAAGGGVDPGTGTIAVGIEQPGASGSNGVVSIGSPGIPSPYRYEWPPATAGVYDTNPAPCPVPTDTKWWRVTRDLAGNFIGVTEFCLGPDAPKPALPAVPTIADIWKFALKDIPHPALRTDPGVGLTGLDTHLWYVGPTTVSIAATIGEWAVTGTAHLERVTFDTGDGTKTAGAPFKTDVTYERKGDRTIVTTARWEADVVMTGPGVAAIPTAIGAALLRSTQPYHVREVRSVLVP
jgi:hypothetical protein